MTPVLFPETHSEENVRSFYVHCERVLKRAHALTAISEHSRQDAIRLLRLDPQRIVTIPCLIPPPYFDVAEAQRQSARAALGLMKPYVLFVSTIEPRKNVGRLLDAWLQLPPDYRDAFELVIAGSAGWRSGELAARLRSGISSVRWLGYVAEEHLPGLTAAAELLAYPSLYEGFGLPPAQALAAGVPVLTSNTSSLPEVVGPGGVMVDPLSVAEIAAGLRCLLDDAALRRRLGALGHQHVSERFTPEPIGAASLRFFEDCCG
jgi:alpha-1,3-rhamnosyl/mannosyltransferase